MAQSTKPTIAISSHDHRLASLFFDRVVPLSSAGEVPDSIRSDRDDWVDSEETKKLLSVALQMHKQVGTEFDAQALNTFDNMQMDLVAQSGRKRGFPMIPIYEDQALYAGMQRAGDHDAFDVEILGAPVIDVSTLEWDQILDARSNEEFKKKLRRFRLMLCDNYEGKDPQYIRDDLLVKLDDYEKACKKHGLELAVSSLSQLLNSKSLLGTLGLAATGILTGNPALASASAIAGGAIEVGKLSLHVAKKKLDFSTSKEWAELAFLIDIRKLTMNDASRKTT